MYSDLMERIENVEHNKKNIVNLDLYKDLTVKAFVEKQVEKSKRDPGDLKEADIRLLVQYYKFVEFNDITIKSDIESVLGVVKELKNIK